MGFFETARVTKQPELYLKYMRIAS